MNIGQIKLWAWGATGVLAIGLAWYVADFVRNREALQKGVDPNKVRDVLNAVEPVRLKNDRTLTYAQAKAVLKEVDWTGAPKPIPVAPKVDDTPVKPQVVPIERLVRITSMRYDASGPEGSRVSVRYKPESGVTAPNVAAFSLYKPGDSLAKPLDYVKVDKIDMDGVTFTFADAERKPEKLSCEQSDTKASIVVVGLDGVVVEPARSGTIVKSDAKLPPPGRSIPLGRNTWEIGVDDLKEMETRWQEILGNEVSTAQHRDPKTGRFDGIEIKSVQPGSIAERHGAQDGDVVKSINGTPVNSTNEAIQFVKTNKDVYTKWEVVVENRGKTRTVTYHTPNR